MTQSTRTRGGVAAGIPDPNPSAYLATSPHARGSSTPRSPTSSRTAWRFEVEDRQHGPYATCGPDEDRSLKGDFHRVYDVFVEDGSGYRIGPFEVDSRENEESAGCAVGTSRAGAVLVVAAVAVVRRRPRREARLCPRA